MNEDKDITILLIDKKIITSDKDISNCMNDYFCTVGNKISDSLSSSDHHFSYYLRNKINASFFLSAIVEPEVAIELNKLNAKKAPGPDALTPKLIKICGLIFLSPLTKIYNTAIEEATYPDKWKLAKVIPLYKKKEHHLPENYRPISLLDTFGKIFERLVYKQMFDFIQKQKILYNRQYGFRPDYSTTLALIETIDSIQQYLDNDEYVLGIFLDIEKAFDTVNHYILLKKT